MSGELASKHCVPCRGGVPPLAGEELRAFQEKLGGGWQVVGEKVFDPADVYGQQ